MKKFLEYYHLSQKMLNDNIIVAMSVIVDVEVSKIEYQSLTQKYAISKNQLKMISYQKVFIINLKINNNYE